MYASSALSSTRVIGVAHHARSACPSLASPARRLDSRLARLHPLVHIVQHEVLDRTRNDVRLRSTAVTSRRRTLGWG